MPAIARKTQLVFGSSLVPGGNLGVWGSLKDGAPAYSDDPAVIQSAEFLNGLNGAIIGNRSPTQEDINGLFYLMTYQLAYLLQSGIPEWDTNTTYWNTNVVRIPGTSFLAASRTDNNQGNNPASDSNNWDVTAVSGGIRAVSSGPGQVIPIDSNAHKLTFGSAAWNPRGYWDVGTSRFTAPLSGLYTVKVNIQVDNASTSQVGLDGFVRVINESHGGAIEAGQGWGQNNPPGARWYPLLVSDIVLTAGDQISIYMGGTNGGGGNVTASNMSLSISRQP